MELRKSRCHYIGYLRQADGYGSLLSSPSVRRSPRRSPAARPAACSGPDPLLLIPFDPPDPGPVPARDAECRDNIVQVCSERPRPVRDHPLTSARVRLRVVIGMVRLVWYAAVRSRAVTVAAPRRRMVRLQRLHAEWRKCSRLCLHDSGLSYPHIEQCAQLASGTYDACALTGLRALCSPSEGCGSDSVVHRAHHVPGERQAQCRGRCSHLCT